MAGRDGSEVNSSSPPGVRPSVLRTCYNARPTARVASISILGFFVEDDDRNES